LDDDGQTSDQRPQDPIKKPSNVIDTGVQPSKILNGVCPASFISLHEGMVPNDSALAVDGLV
jgi:hypothetical protein